MRGIVSFGAEDRYDGAPPPDTFMAEHEALADRVAAEPLLGFRAGIGTVLGISEELLARTVAACGEHGWAVHTHLAEVREEVTESRLRHGHGTVEHVHEAGLLDHEVLAAHCVWCDERDLRLLAASGVAVVHNPVANMLLASGVCPIGRLRREGITVALGTDGAASNDNQDMFGVIKTTGLLHKLAALQADAITAREVLRMATIDGARALGLDRLAGSLEPGKRADIVLLDGNTPELATIHDPWQQVVYCATARCVADVWVDGARRVRAGRLLGADVGALAAEARELGRDLAVRAGLGAESVYAGASGV
jgi:5-methylthioadenosine/S-adenosylhomocysteine deaminase